MKPTDVLPDDVIVDNTLLADMAKCETRTAMRHILDLTTEGEAKELKAGSDIHEALALWLSGFTPEEALAHFKTLYQEWSARTLAGDDRLAYMNLMKILRHWFKVRGAEWPFRVEAEDVEVPMIAVLGEVKGIRVVMVALLDAIGKVKTGGRWSIDHKTTKTVSDWFRQDQEDSSQFTGQLWMAREEGHSLSGVYINALEVRTVPGSDKKCSSHGGSTYKECGLAHLGHDLFPETRPPAELDAWHITAMKLARRYIQLREKIKTVADVKEHAGMQGRFTRSCSRCEFREWCRMGRPKGSAKTFVEQPWRPLDRAQERVKQVRAMAAAKSA